jgi:hypothetical protein
VGDLILKNQQTTHPSNRRQFLAQVSAAVGGGLTILQASPLQAAEAFPAEKKRVAGVITVYRPNSHADVILTKILQGWKHDGGPGPNLELVSLYVDQFPDDDMSVELSRQFGFRICSTIQEALTSDGRKLDIDGVISIGEHGDYPYNDLGQHLYPRRRFFQEIIESFEMCNQVVPVFNDKHPGPQWQDALWMAEQAERLQIPWMAGSSAPVGHREPSETLSWGSPVEACLAVGYSGLDIYGIHTLEFLQSIIERRGPVEQGVDFVQCLPLTEVSPLIQNGVIDQRLLNNALQSSSASPDVYLDTPPNDSALFLVGYRDGLIAPVLMLSGAARAISVAVRETSGRQFATRFDERSEPRYPHFAYLLKGIEQMFLTGKPVYPVERSLLTAGVLDRLLRSRQQGNERLGTPELAIEYQTVDYPFPPQLKLF